LDRLGDFLLALAHFSLNRLVAERNENIEQHENDKQG